MISVWLGLHCRAGSVDDARMDERNDRRIDFNEGPNIGADRGTLRPGGRGNGNREAGKNESRQYPSNHH